MGKYETEVKQKMKDELRKDFENYQHDKVLPRGLSDLTLLLGKVTKSLEYSEWEVKRQNMRMHVNRLRFLLVHFHHLTIINSYLCVKSNTYFILSHV